MRKMHRTINAGYVVETPTGGHAIVIRVFQDEVKGSFRMHTMMAKVQYIVADRSHKVGDITVHTINALRILNRGLDVPKDNMATT